MRLWPFTSTGKPAAMKSHSVAPPIGGSSVTAPLTTAVAGRPTAIPYRSKGARVQKPPAVKGVRKPASRQAAAQPTSQETPTREQALYKFREAIKGATSREARQKAFLDLRKAAFVIGWDSARLQQNGEGDTRQHALSSLTINENTRDLMVLTFNRGISLGYVEARRPKNNVK